MYREPEVWVIQLHDVDLKLLRVFATIVKCGGFSAAQAALNAGPSTISEQMSHLETRLGVKLCQRGRSGFHLRLLRLQLRHRDRQVLLRTAAQHGHGASVAWLGVASMFDT